jgi:protocatechuate 3,4-dioxygenase beta subunit
MKMRRNVTIAIGCVLFSLLLRADGPPPTPAAPPDVSSVGTIAPASEPGQRLILSGTVYGPDGATPAPGVIVYAYQTDATGQYHNDAQRMARLHGWAKTDAAGHYEFRTIHPGPYPGRTIPAHIHFHIYGGGFPLQWTEEVHFSGDKFLRSDEVQQSAAAGRFATVCAVTRDAAGVEHCTFNIRASKTTNYPPSESLELLRR